MITVGTFDGVHRGHWQVLDEVKQRAEARGAASVLLTFHPHPLRIVHPEVAPRLLTTQLEKKEILAEAGLDYVVFLPFTPTLAAYSPREFVEEVLLARLQLCELVIGYDHGLGRGRSGDVATLQRLGRELGFPVHVVPAVLLDGAPISSTRIRHALDQGDTAAAAAGLGRPYSLRGVVVRGEGRGKSLGFPTANLSVPEADKLLPREGIYAVRALLREAAAQGVLHLGPRPTFAGSPPSVELHLFDFDCDIYGEVVRVDFCARIREVHAFASTAELVAAMQEDCAAARRVFASGGAACQVRAAPLD
ncbi:MAG: bifunctional riboflavin kinase/FAD synthetase [Gemmatimonadetes bacterium]|nr:bifunctional riboflavin kinase/FAD synthetase [Gemmatimonadota bacterium]